jgi:hypothetical protein
MRQRDAFDGVRDDAVDIRCECDKRLAWMWENEGNRGPGVDGVELVEFEYAFESRPADPGPWRARHGIRNIGKEDWRRVVCPRCRRDWRGSTDDLVALIRSARVRRSNRVTLRKPTAADYAAPLRTSRRW